MEDLEKYFNENKGRVIHKWKHYFEIYEHHFSRFRGKKPVVVELGVSHGGSLEMWKNYFGEGCQIIGVDINPHCKNVEANGIKVFIGDQSDRGFLKALAKKIPHIDILIDDGGHTMEQQIKTFEVLFFAIDKNGVYLCEDIHTSYLKRWGGGYKKTKTFIEYSKNFIDQIHAWHSQEPNELNVNEFTESVKSLHYYDSILVIEKGPVEKSYTLKTGATKVQGYKPPKKDTSFWKKIETLFS